MCISVKNIYSIKLFESVGFEKQNDISDGYQDYIYYKNDLYFTRGAKLHSFTKISFPTNRWIKK